MQLRLTIARPRPGGHQKEPYGLKELNCLDGPGAPSETHTRRWD